MVMVMVMVMVMDLVIVSGSAKLEGVGVRTWNPTNLAITFLSSDANLVMMMRMLMMLSMKIIR